MEETKEHVGYIQVSFEDMHCRAVLIPYGEYDFYKQNNIRLNPTTLYARISNYRMIQMGKYDLSEVIKEQFDISTSGPYQEYVDMATDTLVVSWKAFVVDWHTLKKTLFFV